MKIATVCLVVFACVVYASAESGKAGKEPSAKQDDQGDGRFVPYPLNYRPPAYQEPVNPPPVYQQPVYQQPVYQQTAIGQPQSTSSGGLFGNPLLLWFLINALTGSTTTTTAATTTVAADTTADAATTAAPTTTAVMAPLDSWKTVDDCRYRLYDTLSTWTEARDACADVADDVHLISVGYNQDNTGRTALLTLIGARSTAFWTGLQAPGISDGATITNDNVQLLGTTPITVLSATTGLMMTQVLGGTEVCGRQDATKVDDISFQDCTGTDVRLKYVCEYCG